MTEKRFGITPELPKGWVDIIDTDDDRSLCNIRIEYANNMIKLLNELNDENEQLKKEIEYYKRERIALFEYIDKKDDLQLDVSVDNEIFVGVIKKKNGE